VGLDVFSLAKKVAVVIGASQPIGRAAAIALAEAGANVAVTTMLRRSSEAEAVSACAVEVGAQGRRSTSHILDITNETDVTTLIQQIVQDYGRIDILVNAPDLAFAKPLTDISTNEWQRVLAVNLTGVYHVCRAVAVPMLAQQHGRIINIVSLLSERGMSNGSAYCAAQGGVLNFTRALSLEWARRGITVNAIGAGWTEGMGMLADVALQQQLARYLPTKRLAQPQEIGEAVVYLASDAAGFLTGQTIWIDGGALSRL
jgi:2-deoxy-D-gluconate 3-dehydrogenase